MKLLELGYTTIRDCGDNSCRGTVALSRSIEAGRLVGPTIIPCGLILCPTAPSTSDGLAERIDGVDNTRQQDAPCSRGPSSLSSMAAHR